MASGFLNILKINLRYQLLPHFLLCLLFLLLTPFLFGTKALDSREAAKLLEFVISLSGIFLLTPLLVPEQNPAVQDILRSKRTPYVTLCIMRFLYSITALALLIGGYTLFLYFNECSVSLRCFLGAFITAAFLGILGLLANSVTNNISVSYMVPVLYFCANLSPALRKSPFYLFSMWTGSFTEKWLLLGASGVYLLLIVGILKKRCKI